MVFVKKSTFFLYAFFSKKKSQKETFFFTLDRKQCSLDLKSEVLGKSKKSTIHGFCQKIDLFLINFFFWVKCKKEIFFDILDSKEYFLDLKSEVLAKLKISTFCKGFSPWFLSKNRPFSYMFFLCKKSQKETFFDILDRW